MALFESERTARNEEMEKAVLASASWEEAQAILCQNKITLTSEDLTNLIALLATDIDDCDEILDKIPYLLVIRESCIHIRQSFGRWITLSRAVLEKMKTFQ